MRKDCCNAKESDLSALRLRQGYILKWVLVINATMFIAEFSSGYFSGSTALMADSLDMLGDAIVYGFSLYVLHKSEGLRATAAFLKGLIIVAFALGVLAQATYKAFMPGLPIAETMGLVGIFAMMANGICLFLLTRHKDDDINMRSTYICSRNDIISNAGVLMAAVAVYLSQSKWPDVLIGYAIAILFFRSAWPILSEALAQIRAQNKKEIF